MSPEPPPQPRRINRTSEDPLYYDQDSITSDTEDDLTMLSSPAGLVYNLDQLSESKKAAVRDAFREPPRIALQHCRRINDTYAFQMSQIVTTSVRIRASKNQSPLISCSCGEQDAPCKHLVWLMDQITSQTIYGHDRTKPLTMAAQGHADEIGDPFQTVARYHLAILAADLHCPIMHPATDDDDDDEEPDPHRVVEARELLSSVYGVDPDDFRPDLFAKPSPRRDVLQPNDLDHTVFRMLLDNPLFFHYFRSLSRPSDAIRDPFRKLSQRVDRVLHELDSYSSNESSMTGLSPEAPANVSWAAAHLVGIVQRIRAAIYTRHSPLPPHEALSAARSLVHILEAVAARSRDAHAGPSRLDRNLYLRLVGDHDEGFVISELDLIPEAASHFLHAIEAIHDEIGMHGAPVSYVGKFRALLSRLRSSGLQRHGSAENARPDIKRMK